VALACASLGSSPPRAADDVSAQTV